MKKPLVKPEYWDEDTWGEVTGEEGYGDGWLDVDHGTFGISVDRGEDLSIQAENAFDAIEKAYEIVPHGTYLEIEGWHS